MSDDLVKQSIAELQDLVRCRCHEAYKGRGLHDPDCHCDTAEAVKAVAARIKDLEAQRKKTYEALLKVTRLHDEAEAKLAKAVEVAEKSIKWLRLYGADVHREAATLAELKRTLEDFG